jgi:exosortase
MLPIVVGLLHATFLIAAARWLWTRDHYQYLPLVAAACGFLAWVRLQGCEWPKSPSLSIRSTAFSVLALLIFALAVMGNSHWLGSIAALCMLWAGICFFGGPQIADRLRGPMLILLLATPLPLNLDLQLIIELQKIATAGASGLLDRYGVQHIVSGVAIQTVQKHFMVEEACSGIHSLFSCLMAMTFWAVVYRYSLLRLSLTLAHTVCWILLANAFRVFIVVYGFARWNLVLDTGFAHELLGVVTYLLALLLSLSMDQFLRFVFPISEVGFLQLIAKGENPAKNTVQVASRLSQVWTAFTRFLDKARLTSRPALIVGVGLLLLAYLPLSVVAHARLFRSASGGSAQNFTSEVSQLITGEALPENVGTWQVIDVRTVSRSPDDILGTNSVIWKLEGNGMQVEFSVDGFYPDWHDLAYCYTATDWRLEHADNLPVTPGGQMTELNLYKSSGLFAISYFMCFDSKLNPVEPKAASGSTVRMLLNRLRSAEFFAATESPFEPPVFQMQLMTSSPRELLDYEKSDLRELFENLRSIVLTRIQEKG